VQELSTVIIALTTSDTELAVQVIRHWDNINEEKHKLMLCHLERLRQGMPETIETSSVHLDLINYLMRIEYYVYQMARVVYGEDPALPSSRLSPEEKSLESE
jgi:phosphate:Na+ symporter